MSMPNSSQPTQPAARPAPQAAAPAKPVGPPGAVPTFDGEREHEGISANFLLFNLLPSTMISFVTHIFIVIIMAFIAIPNQVPTYQNELVSSATEEEEKLEDFEEEISPEMNLDPTAVVSDVSSDVPIQAQQNIVTDPVVVVDDLVADTDAAAVSVELSDFADYTAPKDALAKDIGATSGSGLSGRGAAAAGKFNIKAAGGSEASEVAVAKALKWFADHQNPDGSWSFNHAAGPCQGRCSETGGLDDCRSGATGMALLPFLGAGQTHREGKYKQVVERGLYFLANVQKKDGSLAQGGGNLYSHGICAIALCEAYAMTHDKALLGPAQGSLNFTMAAQDPVGGGWRYSARQAGDTSAVGWQLMALKSGHLAYLRVNPQTIQGAIRFLDSVQQDSGSQYGYTGPGAGPATSAIGLLSRMYLGWKKDNPALQRGVEILAKKGPSPGAMYFNYYATQVMRQAGGEQWDKWNVVMRDSLVNSQSKKGHEEGSWFMRGDHGAERGGRVYCTSLATMILEVYYRHMPIYKSQATEEDFPL
jgi:Squalene-hopene cyclase C-terminal domain